MLLRIVLLISLFISPFIVKADFWELSLEEADSVTCFTENDNYLFAGCKGKGIFRSSDDGENWENTNNGLENTSLFVNQLAVNSQGHIFCSLWPGGLYKSTDSGENWNRIFSEANNILTLYITENDEIFAGKYKGALFLSTDNGKNWENISGDLDENNISCYAVAKNYKNEIFASFNSKEKGGLYCTSSDSINWQILYETEHIPITDVLINYRGTIYIAPQSLLSTDCGNNWEKFDKTFDTVSANYLYLDESDRLICYWMYNLGNYMAYTPDGIKYWRMLNSEPYNSSQGLIYWSRYMVGKSGHFFIGKIGKGLYKSLDVLDDKFIDISIETESDTTMDYFQSRIYTIYVKNMVTEEKLYDVRVLIDNSIEEKQDTLILNGKSKNYAITIPGLKPDGKYNITFKFDKIGFRKPEPVVKEVEVLHDPVSVDNYLNFGIELKHNSHDRRIGLNNIPQKFQLNGIYDYSGRMIETDIQRSYGQENVSFTIKYPDLVTGLYYLLLNSQDRIITIPVVIE